MTIRFEVYDLVARPLCRHSNIDQKDLQCSYQNLKLTTSSGFEAFGLNSSR